MILRFAADLAVGFTSNQAERDIRPVKVQQRTSGGTWRTLLGLADFAIIQSYLSTAGKWGIGALDALTRLFTDGPGSARNRTPVTHSGPPPATTRTRWQTPERERTIQHARKQQTAPMTTSVTGASRSSRCTWRDLPGLAGVPVRGCSRRSAGEGGFEGAAVADHPGRGASAPGHGP